MNRIYEIDEGRPFWKLRPMQLFVTIVTLVLIVVIAIILVVSGPVVDAIGNALNLGETVQVAWEIIKWPVLALAVVFAIALLYYATPNAKQPKFRWISVGAVLAILALVIASAGFALYVVNFSNYDRTYGSFAGVIVFLLWLWISNCALLFGAEFDAELERGRQLQAGIEAEVDIQLPPRDTRKSEKAAAKEEKDVELGRRIRLEHAGQDGAGRDEGR
jgi:membrane protein